MNLTKHELVNRISEETGLIQTQAADVIQKIFDCIIKTLAAGDKVELRNFGIFELKVRRAHTAHNPHQPKKLLQIPERVTVKFKPGKNMRDKVLKLSLKKVK
jgi:nucleoid DNA-binding protein